MASPSPSPSPEPPSPSPSHQKTGLEPDSSPSPKSRVLQLWCEHELSWLDMSINSKKSCCMRIGPRCNYKCSNLTTSCGSDLPWVTDIRYLGVHIVQSRLFKCSFDQAKRAFHRSLNAVYGRVGRYASEEVVIKIVTIANVCQFYYMALKHAH